jgi:pimeloyl-ACP methyl ester carboxylesterase
MPFFKFQNKNIYYETYGQGKPILLLNGLMMSTRSWIPFIETFSENNQLLLIDFLDQGQSEKLSGQEYAQSIQVELLHEFLNHLKLERVNLAGISYGGEVALQFATTYPKQVERLILLNTTAATSPQLSDIGKAWNKAAASGDGAAYFYTAIPVIYSAAFYERKLQWLKAREKILIPIFGNPAFTSAMIRLTNSAESHDVRSKLNLISSPTLIISSDQDYLTPIPEQRYLVSHIAGASHVIIQDTGHASMYEQPAVFATLIIGFFNIKTTSFPI